LFYELFQFDPQSLIQLLKLNLEGQYAFESISIKTTEKRLDGFFKRIDGEGPNIFLETQGYDDPKIHWRLFRKICTFYEQRDDPKPFIATILQLTPIEQTTVGKQIFGRGEIIGKIQFAQQLLKQPLSPKEELAQKTAEELKSILRQLETELESSLHVQ
jgi:hypothetical protein